MMSGGFVDLVVDRDQLRRMLDELGLAEPDEPIEVRMLTGGVSSNIFRIDLRCGPVCVKQALPKLKVQKDWYAPIGRVLAEIDWLMLAQPIVPGHVPPILGADRARGAFVMPYLDGMRNWKSDLLAGRVDAAVGRAVADVLGRIHAATARDAALAGRFANDANFFALRLEPYLIESARVHPDLARELVALVHATQHHPWVLVHGDVSPKNVLIGDGATGEEGPMLLDAECAWYGDPAFDLAFLLNHVLLKAVHRPDAGGPLRALHDGIVEGYLSHVQWEDRDGFERRCARLLPGLLLARIDGKSPVEYLAEAPRAQVRRLARAMLQEPPHTLKEVRERCVI